MRIVPEARDLARAFGGGRQLAQDQPILGRCRRPLVSLPAVVAPPCSRPFSAELVLLRPDAEQLWAQLLANA